MGSFADAARFGEIVVLAVKGTIALDVLELAGGDTLAGKTVIDPTNPIAAAPPVNGVLKFFTNLDESLMERLQAAHPKVNFVKAFNSVGNPKMVNPQYSAGRPTMFICGNDDAAKSAVSGVLDQFGWERSTWAWPRPHARLSRSACSGASRASSGTSGRTRSRCFTPDDDDQSITKFIIIPMSSCSRLWQWSRNMPRWLSNRVMTSTASSGKTRTVSFHPRSQGKTCPRPPVRVST